MASNRPLLPVVALLLAIASVMEGNAATDPPPKPVPHQDFIRVIDRPWERVGLSVTVTDPKGRPVTGLTREEFRVFDGGHETEVMEFGPEGGRRDRPLSVAVLLDMSQSMGSQVRKVHDAARALLSALRPGDEILIAKFNDQVTVLQPFTGQLNDPERILDRIGRARGGTAIFRAVDMILRDLRDRPGRKIILVVSDGYDNDIDREKPVLQSLYLQDLLRLCFRTGTIVYGVRPGMAATSWLPFEGFVDQTGGRLLYTGGDLPGLFARLGEEFLSQYHLGYDIDPKQGEGKWRRVKVEVTRPGVVVKSLQGYFTPRGHVNALLGDLYDRDAEVRADAAYGLGFEADARAGPALRTALRDQEPEVRRLAIEALVRLGDRTALPALVGCLSDGDITVGDIAAAALEAFGTDSVPFLLEAVTGPADERRSPTSLERAITLLGRVGDDRALEPLSVLLCCGPIEARVAAARALGDLRLGSGLAPLRAGLGDADAGVRRAALQSILMVSGDAARALVEDHLRRETDPAVRAAAEAALETP